MSRNEKVAVAPMQGYTDAPFRHYHSEIYGGGDTLYCSPFLRVEHGDIRRRDLRDITSPFNEGMRLLPQVIFRDVEEFTRLVDAVAGAGFDRIDLNMGCPFPPQVKKGRGAGLLANVAELEKIAAAVESRNGITFSVKMRLGITSPDEFIPAVPLLNRMPLSHVTVHPRVAAQQYGGELYMDAYARLRESLSHPVIFNGDVATPADIDAALSRSDGVMIGRGLLARPSLIAEWREGREWSADERLEKIMRFHNEIFAYYADTLCGDTQILMKIKPFWDYLESEIGHKTAKLIKKATTVAKYQAAIG
ncbi:MAG: tRNA-dihydrouridine synthase family protein [Candidatus Homeothermus sp.]|nr:tRNA-dihydrouridine synthase family protein [Candidatus Homeothermus sp.]